MNLRGGWALIRRSLFSYMSQRGFFWTLTLGWMMAPLVYLFVWTTAASQGAIGGYERSDFVVYYLCMIVINQFTFPTSHWTVGEYITYGGFSNWLLHPLPVIYEAIAPDLALKMVCMPFALIMVVVLSLVFQVSFSFSIPHIVYFSLVIVLAQIMRFIIAYVLALSAFWSQRADALLGLNDSLVFLFAGQVAPTALLPGLLRQVATVLPYRYMLGFPIEVLMGRLSSAEILVGLGWQAGWLAVALLLYRLVWRRGLRRYVATGG